MSNENNLKLESAKEGTVERVELFTLNGKSFYVEKRPYTNVALKVSRIAKKEGEQAAADYLLEKLLGEEQYEEFLEFDDLKPEDLGTIMELATIEVFGTAELPQDHKDPKATS